MKRLGLLLCCLLWAATAHAQNINDFLSEGWTPDCITVSNGDFATAGIWSCGHVPGSTERAQISHTVTWTTGNIGVWTLYIAAVGDLTGNFSADCGNTHTLTITDTPHTDTNQYETGLIVLGGLHLTGCSKTTWLRTAAAVASGAGSVSLPSIPANWKSGDRVVLPDTRFWRIGGVLNYPGLPDIMTLSGDVTTTTASFTGTTARAHPTARDAAGVARRYPFIGNLTRNVIITSASSTATTRGYTIFSDAADIDIYYVTFRWLGRTRGDMNLDAVTNHIARYASHLHGMVGAPIANIQHNVFEDTPTSVVKWPITIHGTAANNVVSDNLVLYGYGAGLMTEAGTEASTIEDNLIATIEGDDQGGDTGEEGKGGNCVWLEGTLNYFRRNVMVGCRHAGVQLWDKILGMGQEGANRRPVAAWEDNEIVNTGFGFYPWYVGKLGTPSYIRGQIGWHNQTDAFIYPSLSLYFINWLSLGDPTYSGATTTEPSDAGFHFGDYDTRDFHADGVEIQNKDHGITPPFGVSGGGGGFPDPRTSYFSNLTFANNGTDFKMEFGGSVGCDTSCMARVNIVTNSVHSASHPSTWHFQKFYDDNTNINLRVPFILRVKCYQLNCGDNFDVYAVSGTGHTQTSQEPSASMAVDGASSGLIGCPTGSLTNAQCQSMYAATTDGGYATGGQTTPVTATTRTKIDGKVQAITPVTATWVGLDTTTLGSWHGVYGATGVGMYTGSTAGWNSTTSLVYLREAGSMLTTGSGQRPAFGGDCTVSSAIPVDYIQGATNQGSSVACTGDGTIANGQMWPDGAGHGDGFVSRVDNSKLIKYQAIRFGVTLAGPVCFREYLPDANNGDGHGPRTYHIDLYEGSNVPGLDATGSTGVSKVPLQLLDSRDVVVGANTGVYPAWNLSAGSYVFEFAPIAPLAEPSATGGMVILAGSFLDPTCGISSSRPRVRRRGP